MAEQTPEKLQLVLTADEGLGKIAVDMDAFFEFSFELAEELEDLVARWKHFAPPRKSRPRSSKRPQFEE